jgi:LppP/LprE lipoprotein
MTPMHTLRLSFAARLLVSAVLLAWPAVGAASAAADDESWLDQPLSNWNEPGMSIPQAPAMDPSTNPRCLPQRRQVETDADQAIADSGWTIYGGYQAGWNTYVVRGLSGYDGMCRPLGYNEFVFVDGQFAGTISPDLMNSRTDGAGDVRFFVQKDSLSAEFLRYTPTDPLCCPSANASVFYQVQHTDNGPVLVPMSITQS